LTRHEIGRKKNDSFASSFLSPSFAFFTFCARAHFWHQNQFKCISLGKIVHFSASAFLVPGCLAKSQEGITLLQELARLRW